MIAGHTNAEYSIRFESGGLSPFRYRAIPTRQGSWSKQRHLWSEVVDLTKASQTFLLATLCLSAATICVVGGTDLNLTNVLKLGGPQIRSKWFNMANMAFIVESSLVLECLGMFLGTSKLWTSPFDPIFEVLHQPSWNAHPSSHPISRLPQLNRMVWGSGRVQVWVYHISIHYYILLYITIHYQPPKSSHVFC